MLNIYAPAFLEQTLHIPVLRNCVGGVSIPHLGHFIMHLLSTCCKDDRVSSTERRFHTLDSRHQEGLCNRHTKFQVACGAELHLALPQMLKLNMNLRGCRK